MFSLPSAHSSHFLRQQHTGMVKDRTRERGSESDREREREIPTPLAKAVFCFLDRTWDLDMGKNRHVGVLAIGRMKVQRTGSSHMLF